MVWHLKSTRHLIHVALFVEHGATSCQGVAGHSQRKSLAFSNAAMVFYVALVVRSSTLSITAFNILPSPVPSRGTLPTLRSRGRELKLICFIHCFETHRRATSRTLAVLVGGGKLHQNTGIRGRHEQLKVWATRKGK